MTTVKFKVDDERLEAIEKLLRENPFVTDIKVESDFSTPKENAGQYQRIQKLLDEAKGKGFFKDIEDPVEWQREIRKERD